MAYSTRQKILVFIWNKVHYRSKFSFVMRVSIFQLVVRAQLVTACYCAVILLVIRRIAMIIA
ncbi:unnamed protein product [Amoebophrya sp. A25]|nr:unnamed protein product [Amoebophrya sp. A25]|eukprot:GSA25T00013993001.1